MGVIPSYVLNKQLALGKKVRHMCHRLRQGTLGYTCTSLDGVHIDITIATINKGQVGQETLGCK